MTAIETLPVGEADALLTVTVEVAVWPKATVEELTAVVVLVDAAVTVRVTLFEVVVF